MKKLGLILVTATLLVAGCRVATEGNQGNILFEPRDCGLLVCAFSKGLAVGGSMEAQISGIDNYPTAGVNLASGDLSVLDVYVVADVNGRATWGLGGVQEALVNLEAVDANSVLADYIGVQVSVPDALVSQHFSGQAVGPTADGVYQEIWQINVGEDVRFNVVPQLRGASLMGNMVYGVSADAALVADSLAGADFVVGHIYFNAQTAGDYSITLTGSSGESVNILYQAQ